MKLSLSKRERLALCVHVVPQRVENLEQARLRRLAWKATDSVDLATDVQDLIAAGAVNIGQEWFDRTPQEFELEATIVEFLHGATKPPYAGIHAEHMLSIHERLEKAKDEK